MGNAKMKMEIIKRNSLGKALTKKRKEIDAYDC